MVIFLYIHFKDITRCAFTDRIYQMPYKWFLLPINAVSLEKVTQGIKKNHMFFYRKNVKDMA